MTITAAELRTIGNERTGRSESQADIDKFVLSFVHELTTRGIVIEAEESLTFVDEQANYVESTYLTTNTFKKINAITIIDSNSNESAPLIEISWQRYKERQAYSTSPGEPKEYARFNKTLYFWPAPDADSYPTAKVSGTIHHADSTTISYADRFREAATQYVVFKIYEKYGLAETKGKTPAALYEREFNMLKASQDNSEVNAVRYSDI